MQQFKDYISFLGVWGIGPKIEQHTFYDLTNILKHIMGNSIKAIWFNRNDINAPEEISKTMEDPQGNIEI